MADIEIPLLRCANTYACRLIEAAKKFADSRYQFHRRVNWSYRYSKQFYGYESDRFIDNPQQYINDQIDKTYLLEDVFKTRLSMKQVAIVVVKVLAHWVFYILGALTALGAKGRFGIYRKAYVDDIELVFDPDQAGVMRAVYPFPLNAMRQLRYFLFLRKNGYKFKTDGNPYSPVDLLRLLMRRDLHSLQRMESRAQIRHAYEVAALGVKTVQMSDEFDVGNLDFCRAIRRLQVRIINSAHGVGTYLPIHAYHEFHVLTQHQRSYYKPIYDCEYRLRSLNVKKSNKGEPTVGHEFSKVVLVFLSQTSFSVTQIVSENEVKVVARLAAEFASSPNVELLYRAHPNNHTAITPLGFQPLRDLAAVNGHPGTIFVSLFSTCYLDPNFIGRKLLIRIGLIYPELVFDNMDDILDLDGLIRYVNHVIANPSTLQT